MIWAPFAGAAGCCPLIQVRGMPTTPADAIANDA
jgi:hypothetical protein